MRTGEARVSVIIPAYNEGAQIIPVLDRLFESVRLPAEVLVIVDAGTDTTVPVIEEYAHKEPRLRYLVNTHGRGPANAIRYGIEAAAAPVAIVTMADGCDDARQIDELARLVERGVAVAAASRYMAGGQQVGGPYVKGTLSKLAGRSLRLLAHVGTRDATNSFKAYATDFVRQVGIESRDGFEIGIELTAKARRLRRPVAEIPTIWLDRQAGLSNFRVARWIPKYLRWYRFAFGRKLTPEEIRTQAARHRRRNASQPQLTERQEMEKVLVSGSAGFIGGYVVEELLSRGYAVIGIDNFSKYGRVTKSYDANPYYTLVEGDARNVDLMTSLLADCDQFIAGAAMIGGISYFHTYAYDLLATNERIIAASCDAAIKAHRDGRLRKVTYLSSSMVFECANHWPSHEGQEREIPPPLSSYGFQKLAVEYFARAAWDQYQLPYSIARPFNCVGVGESRALGDEEILSGNVRLAMSHVVPDLVQKVLKGQDPLHIFGSGEQLRHYTYGGDLAQGIVTVMSHPRALNEDFNLSTAESTTVLRLAELIWQKIKGPVVPLRIAHDDPFGYDVQRRQPATEKAKRILGYEATTTLDQMLDEVIPWISQAIAAGTM